MKTTKKTPATSGRCEDCVYYDVTDEESGDRDCTLAFDEDEYLRYRLTARAVCPYFRYYDEYKSVQKQN